MSYETDLYEWTKEQAEALRRRASNALDWDNLAEEIESLGTSNLDQIESRLENLILHLLKWKYQPEMQCGSWRGSILRSATSHRETDQEDDPSLGAYPGEYLAEAYPVGRRRALAETGLLHLPEICPWTIEDVLAEDFLTLYSVPLRRRGSNRSWVPATAAKFLPSLGGEASDHVGARLHRPGAIISVLIRWVIAETFEAFAVRVFLFGAECHALSGFWTI